MKFFIQNNYKPHAQGKEYLELFVCWKSSRKKYKIYLNRHLFTLHLHFFVCQNVLKQDVIRSY